MIANNEEDDEAAHSSAVRVKLVLHKIQPYVCMILIQKLAEDYFQQLEMILDLKNIRGYSFEQPQQDSWDHKFVNKLIQVNQDYLSFQQNSQEYAPSNIASMLDFINCPPLPEETPSIVLPIYPHSYYSSFLPLRCQNYKWADQFQKQYSYLTFLEEQCFEESQQNVERYLAKNQSLVLSKKREVGEKLNPYLSVVGRVWKRAQLLKHGSGILKGCEVDIGAWSHSLSRVDGYLNGSQTKLRHNLFVTVEANQKISQDVISRTMKNLYCPVCLIYDCFIHDALGETNQFVSFNNKINQEVHLSKAIRLISDFLESKPSTIASFSESEIVRNQPPICSNYCYKIPQNIKKGAFSSLSLLAKSVIEIGIHLFSFEPCLISKLFQPLEIKCSQIFDFLINQCSLFNRIECKFYPSEEDMLINEQRQLVGAHQMLVCENKKKKKKKNVKNPEEKTGGKPICFHHFVNEPSQDIECKKCDCRKRGFCVPECLCSSSCSLMKIGCKCKSIGSCRTNQCPCFKNKIECHPGLCRACCGEERVNCKNLNIQRRVRKNIRIGVSKISEAGLGAYAGQLICKDELVTVYLAESVQPCIEEMRHSTTRDSSFYNFDTNGLTLDARFIGNKARFINHGDKKSENLAVQILQSQGQQWICFFALRDIQEHEQLYFDYDGTGELAKHHRQKYPFIACKK